MHKIIKHTAAAIAFLALGGLVSACDDSKSYAELLDDEEKAMNWYLAQNRVEVSIPEDSVFVTGKDAPFYRLRNDGSVYMRVINRGDMSRRPKTGDRVYFRFTRYDVQNMYRGYPSSGVGNNTDLSYGNGGLSLVYGNNELTSTTQYGEGLQMPLDFLGYDCEVDLLVKSTAGFSSEISSCVPYVYKNLKYFKAEY